MRKLVYYSFWTQLSLLRLGCCLFAWSTDVAATLHTHVWIVRRLRLVMILQIGLRRYKHQRFIETQP